MFDISQEVPSDRNYAAAMRIALVAAGTLCLASLLIGSTDETGAWGPLYLTTYAVSAIAAVLVVFRLAGRILAATVFAALGLCVVVYLFMPVPASTNSLHQSLERETGSAALVGACSRTTEPDVWACRVSDDSGSGTATYEVTLDGRCWNATLSASDSEGPMPKRASGCTRLRDRL